MADDKHLLDAERLMMKAFAFEKFGVEPHSLKVKYLPDSSVEGNTAKLSGLDPSTAPQQRIEVQIVLDSTIETPWYTYHVGYAYWLNVVAYTRAAK